MAECIMSYYIDVHNDLDSLCTKVDPRSHKGLLNNLVHSFLTNSTHTLGDPATADIGSHPPSGEPQYGQRYSAMTVLTQATLRKPRLHFLLCMWISHSASRLAIARISKLWSSLPKSWEPHA